MNDLISISADEGDSFTIFSSISEAYLDPGKLALGFFQICIGGVFFGVCRADATLLACSFDEVNRRLKNRGSHRPSFIDDAAAAEIALSFLRSVYGDEENASFLGLPREKFIDDLYGKFLIWAPDGDQAFDDGSIVLQFDVGNMVRLIGFRRSNDVPMAFIDLQDVYLEEGIFYGVLDGWISAFGARRQILLENKRTLRP